VTETLTCRECVGILAEHLDGALQPDEQRAVDAHLATCRSCRTYLSTYRATIVLAKAVSERSEADDTETPPRD